MPAMTMRQPRAVSQMTVLVQRTVSCRSQVKYTQWGMAPSHAQKRSLLLENCKASPFCELR